MVPDSKGRGSPTGHRSPPVSTGPTTRDPSARRLCLSPVGLEDLLQRLSQKDPDPGDRPPAEWIDDQDDLVTAIVTVLRTPYLRPEHRRRIREDLVACAPLLASTRSFHVVDLILWSEHVESLHKGLRSGGLKTFHFTRALEATCHRCGFELLPLMSEMEAFARDWGAREIGKTWERVRGQYSSPPGQPIS